jgi:predicted esterase
MKKLFAALCVLVLFYWWNKAPEISVLHGSKSFSYLVKYPASARSVALHGNGDTAENFYSTGLSNFSVPARIILLKAPISYAGGKSWPMNGEELTEYGKAVAEAIHLLSEEYPTEGKPALLGFSGGAVMAYYQSLFFGDSYSVIFPVSGKLPAETSGEMSAAASSAPVYAFHGKQDQVIPFRAGQKAVELLEEEGRTVEFVEFEGDHLGFFTNMNSQILGVLAEKFTAE